MQQYQQRLAPAPMPMHAFVRADCTDKVRLPPLLPSCQLACMLSIGWGSAVGSTVSQEDQGGGTER